MRLRVVARLLQIQRVLVRHGLDELILATHLFRPLRYAFYLSPATWFERRKGGPRGERIRLALEELGPIWVKFGQALSTRRDLLPVDIADELAKLQDRVPPFPGAEARAIVEQAYGKPVAEVFESFDEDAARRRLDRAGAHRAPALGRGRGHQGPAPRRARADRARHRGHVRAGGPRARLRQGGLPPAAPRGRAGIREDHPRRARPDARVGQRRAAEAQFRRLRPALRAGRVLGLLPPRSDGDGAHPRRAGERHGRAPPPQHQHPGAGRERRGDLLHAGVPPQLLPRRHAPGQHLRAGRRPAAAALCGCRLRHRRHARRARPALPGRELPRLLRPRLQPRRPAARRLGLGAARTRASTSSRPRSARCASRSSTSRCRRSRSRRC